MSGEQPTDGTSRRRVLELTGGSLATLLAGRTAAAAPRFGHPPGRKDATFSDPVRLNPPGKYGYEPSVAVDPYGTIYATAHKSSVTNEGTRLSSFFWYSIDGGDTWQDMPSNAQVDNEQYAFEGDIAVDAKGRVYYCDTYLGDNQFNRWLTEPNGPVWDYSKPMQGTSGVDDRPWLQAHGDGIVYYLGNNGISVPDPSSPGSPARIWFYRSTDGGLTWSEGYGFPTGGYCSIAADKTAAANEELDGKTVYVATADGEGSGARLELYTSTDAGQTWTLEQDVDTYDQQPSQPFHTWSVTDRAGNPYHVWIDDDPDAGRPGRINLTRGDVGDWETLDVTPFDGAFTKQWVGAGREGLVAVTYYGTEPGVTKVRSDTAWYPYVTLTRNAQDPEPKWETHRLTDAPVSRGAEPEDFFEIAVGPKDRIHVTFARVLDSPGTFRNPTRTYRNNLLYVQGRIPGVSSGDGVDGA